MGWRYFEDDLGLVGRAEVNEDGYFTGRCQVFGPDKWHDTDSSWPIDVWNGDEWGYNHSEESAKKKIIECLNEAGHDGEKIVAEGFYRE